MYKEFGNFGGALMGELVQELGLSALPSIKHHCSCLREGGSKHTRKKRQWCNHAAAASLTFLREVESYPLSVLNWLGLDVVRLMRVVVEQAVFNARFAPSWAISKRDRKCLRKRARPSQPEPVYDSESF